MIPSTRHATLPLLFTALLFALGCGSSSPPPTEPTSVTPPSETPAAPAADAEPAEPISEITVQIKSWEEVQQLVADQKGKVVVVDIWSTWCIPCVREFPNLVQLQKDHPDNVACISVDANYSGVESEPPESFQEEVLEFLLKQEAKFQNVICSDPDTELFDKVGIASIPAVLVYDREGTLQKKFTNDDQEYGDEGFTYEDHIVPLVEQLLAP
jgi:thiol-disulfide isomerase/thioredoxin